LAYQPEGDRVGELGVGEVGFLVANIKNVGDAKIGDTIIETARPTVESFPASRS
jgi:GTP-binding protein LepA